MKVLLVDGAPFFGGQARHVYDLANGLTVRGHCVTVACRHPQLEESLLGAGIACRRLPFRGGVDPQSIGLLFGLIKDSKFDIVHTHGVRAGLFGRVAGKLSGSLKLVHTVHTMGEDLVRGKGPICGVKRCVYAKSEARLAGLTDGVIAVSDDLRKRLIGNGIAGRKIVTIHSGVDLSKYENLEDQGQARGRIGVPKGCKLVGTIARFTHQKNLSDFLRAAKIISREYDDVMFALVGDGPESEALKIEAKELGIAHRTVFTGYQREIAKILPAFDVFMLSSLWEGHPLSVLEAMAASVPVVATAVTGVAETIEQGVTGYIVQPGDIEGLAHATCKLLSDRQNAVEMGEKGRQITVDKFGLERMIQEVEQVYLILAEYGAYRQAAEIY